MVIAICWRKQKNIGFNFDLTISVQEAGAFKPDWRTYAEAEKIIHQKFGEIERSGFFLLPITHLIASVRRLTDLGPCSSIDANDPLGKVHSSLTLLLKTSMNCQIS